jgi:ferric-dicitrate binding protein FerR (iron transport regulator)
MDDLELLKFIKKELSQDEATVILGWIEESEENRKRYNELKNIWAFSAISSDSATISDSAIISDSGENNDDPGEKSSVRSLIIKVLKYAAVIVITLGLSFLWQDGFITLKKKEKRLISVSAPLGQSAIVMLADGSRVTLNAGTVLTYSHDYSRKERNVGLTGEAFFEVNSDRNNPFTVNASGIGITATGTSFNVDAYTEGNQVDVTLVEGHVDLYSAKGKAIASLEPGENISVDLTSDNIEITQVDTRFYTSWQQGLITFSNRRLEDIALDLERWYSVEIEFMSDSCKEIRYSGTILKSKPVDQVLQILQLTTDFEFDIEVINNKLSRIIIKE